WKQRLALGCAILHQPSILFLDEPTSGVDPLSRRRFWDLIYEMAGKGVTIFVTTHYMDEAEYCDRLALINQGKIVALGTPEELKKERMPEDVWELEVGARGTVLRPFNEAMEALKGHPQFSEVAVFGNTLHVLVKKGEDLSAVIPRILEKQSIPVRRLEKIAPTLEDVFVFLVEEKGKVDELRRLLEEVSKLLAAYSRAIVNSDS
ncbi:MAG: DUF4162 domain-containing protein, partial [Deltaproteobacteria bacterium]|nr:DUF4162 domain-containing protein [Deltaproteobacteria bacterium]